MRLRSATLEELDLPLRSPFVTSFGVERRRSLLLLRLTDRSGEVGYGECVAAAHPLYSYENVGTARLILERYLLPAVLNDPRSEPGRLPSVFRWIRGHSMAKAAVEMALWDLAARRRGASLTRLLGGRRTTIEVGVSVGIARTPAELVRQVHKFVEAGYRRVKLKIAPGQDEAYVRKVRKEFPGLTLWVDGNQAYKTQAGRALRSWAERWEIEQVEQPFSERALESHARLQRNAPFRVCLDESIVDRESLSDAMDRRALEAVNVKPGRLGGHGPAREIAEKARRSGVFAWVGGMLETGVGRAHNVALAALSPFNLPGDISASDRYFATEIIDPPFELGPGSTLSVPSAPGIGVELVERAVKRFRRTRWTGRP